MKQLHSALVSTTDRKLLNNLLHQRKAQISRNKTTKYICLFFFAFVHFNLTKCTLAGKQPRWFVLTSSISCTVFISHIKATNRGQGGCFDAVTFIHNHQETYLYQNTKTIHCMRLYQVLYTRFHTIHSFGILIEISFLIITNERDCIKTSTSTSGGGLNMAYKCSAADWAC